MRNVKAKVLYRLFFKNQTKIYLSSFISENLHRIVIGKREIRDFGLLAFIIIFFKIFHVSGD